MRFALALLFLGLAACRGAPPAPPPPEGDARYLYQDLVVDPGPPLRVRRGSEVLLDAGGAPLFVPRGGGLRVGVEAVPRPGGFDLVYRVENPTGERVPMPDLVVPGVRLAAADGLWLLNPYKLYRERRWLADEIGHGGYLVPAAGWFRYRDAGGRIVPYESDPLYGAETNGAYAPVVVASDGRHAVGAALIYDFLAYRDPGAPVGAREVKKDKLYPRTRVVARSDGWDYVFAFDPDLGRVPPGASYRFVVAVRFAPDRYWLLTLAPYKAFLDRRFPHPTAPPRDPRPRAWIALSYPGNTEARNPRGWSWYYNDLDEEGRAYLPIAGVAEGLARVLPRQGYAGAMLHGLTGQYYVPRDHPMYDEIPYPFATGFEPGMADAVGPAIARLRSAGLRVALWWGIAGMMPLGEDGAPLPVGAWIPARDRPYRPDREDDRARALAEVQAAAELGPDAVGLDAYARMEEGAALGWLGDLHERWPGIAVAAELQTDLYHRRAAIFLQRYREDSDLDWNRIERAPVLASYLNPGAAVWAWVYPWPELGDVAAHVRRLARMGYTVFLSHRPFAGAYRDEPDLAKRIEGQADAFPDLSGPPLELYACLNGRDDDGDGLADWPYDPGCSAPEDDAE